MSFNDEKYDTSKITITKITLPWASDKMAFYLDSVYTEEECKEMIDMTEKRGYSEALLNIGYQQQVRDASIRNNDRCMFDDADMAKTIYDRIQSFLPTTWHNKQFEAVSLNERLRFLRYYPGQEFKPHYDGEYHREDSSKERSYVTVQLYLNTVESGGSTIFLDRTKRHEPIKVIPKPGRVLVFQHDILHSGEAVNKGIKYCLRTDVMYAPNIDEILKRVNADTKAKKW